MYGLNEPSSPKMMIDLIVFFLFLRGREWCSFLVKEARVWKGGDVVDFFVSVAVDGARSLSPGEFVACFC